MPIIERDKWLQPYFSDVECPDNIIISTDDRNSFNLYPQHRWVYDKTNLCKTQNIRHAACGEKPQAYPVFSKPITNLYGMGVDSHLLRDEADYAHFCKTGRFWMEYLTGDHISSDVALVDGEVVWQGHTEGMAAGEGTFNYWHILSKPLPTLENYYQKWLREHLRGYVGMANIESIGGKIIEVHLRVVDQWPDLYGPGWVKSVVDLYSKGIWTGAKGLAREGFSVVLFGPHGRAYEHPPESLIEELKCDPAISSVQITFKPGALREAHAMPPGGFRLAVINCFDLEAGHEARERLAEFFGIDCPTLEYAVPRKVMAT